MSDMQLYLIALGGIIIAVVILYNWWQERRLSQDAVRRYDGPADDPLMDGIRVESRREVEFDESTLVIEDTVVLQAEMPPPEPEPEVGIAQEGVPLEEIPLEYIPENTLLADLPGMTQEDVLEAAPAASDASAESRAAPGSADDAGEDEEDAPPRIELPAGMDEQIDLVAVVSLGKPCTGEELREALQPLPGFEKATQWGGRDTSGAWLPLTGEQAQTRFEHVACALQYADRSGAVSRECLRKFRRTVETLAERLGAAPEWRDHGDPLRYAADVDQFCIDVDVMVGFHLMHGAGGPFAATKLRGLAEAGGLRLREDGAFHFENEEGDTLFTLVSRDHRPFTPELLRTAFIGGVSFQMDVPRVRNCPEAFNRMTLLARQMEGGLDGRLLDDNQQPLDTAAMDKIREQLRIIYAKMVARGIIPGSPTALRLFS